MLAYKVAALLENDEKAEDVTEQLAKLKVPDLHWRVYRPEVDHGRIVAAPRALGAADTAGATFPAAGVVQADLPEQNVLEDVGLDNDVAEYFAQGLSHGAVAVVIEAPREHEKTVHRILAGAGVTRIVEV